MNTTKLGPRITSETEERKHVSCNKCHQDFDIMIEGDAPFAPELCTHIDKCAHRLGITLEPAKPTKKKKQPKEDTA